MKNITGNFFILNNRLISTTKANHVFPDIGKSVYEVIRIIEGIPLFLEDHLSRLNNSLLQKEIEFDLHNQNINNMLDTIIQANNIQEGNVRIDILVEQEITSKIVYQIPAYYPSPDEYRDGVRMITFHAERINPGIKQTNLLLRKKIEEALAASGCYEAVLVTRDKLVTEGSRSNIFFVKNDKLYTAPDSMVLEGITASWVKTICRESGIELFQQPVKLSVLNTFDACFITGTSPKILPVRAIDSISYDVGRQIIIKIRNEYEWKIRNYIAEKKAIKE